jgi:hypothetical protein
MLPLTGYEHMPFLHCKCFASENIELVASINAVDFQCGLECCCFREEFSILF